MPRIGRPARRGEAPQNQASGGGLRLQNACAGASARVLAALAASKHEELEAEALDDAGIYVAAGETRNDVVRRTGLSLSYREAYLAAPGASPAKRGIRDARHFAHSAGRPVTLSMAADVRPLKPGDRFGDGAATPDRLAA
jgi:hypothetical protein